MNTFEKEILDKNQHEENCKRLRSKSSTAIATTCLCESVFPVLPQIITKTRNCFQPEDDL